MRYEYWHAEIGDTPTKIHEESPSYFGQAYPKKGELVSLDKKTYVVVSITHFPKSFLVRIFLQRDPNELMRLADEEKEKVKKPGLQTTPTKELVELSLQRERDKQKQDPPKDDDWGDY